MRILFYKFLYWFQNKEIRYICYLISAFILFILCFSHPIMFLNDEWITGNQLSQLNEHHQILYAEGKYGFVNGTPTPYFKEKNLLLQYSTYLPILSYPSLLIIKKIGYSLPFFVSLCWSLIFIINSLIIKKKTLFKIYSRIITNGGILLGILFFILNLCVYAPIKVNSVTSNDELLGVGLFHYIIFVLLLWTIYHINITIFNSNEYSIFATITCISCSSYLFWVSTLKDHIDSVFYVTLIIYALLKYQKSHDIWFFTIAFIVAGLLTWVRPEYGSVILCTVFILYISSFFVNKYGQPNSFLAKLISPVFVFIGIIPLLIGNYLTTGHLFTLAWQVRPLSTNISEQISSIPPDTTVLSIIQVLLSRITPHTENLPSDLYGFLINPITLKVPILAITPVFSLGILMLPFIYYFYGKKILKSELVTIIILMSIVISTIIAYASSITGLGTSMGIYPDVRYLTPIYIPLNIIGLMIIQKIFYPSDIRKFVTFFLVSSSIGILGILGIITICHSNIEFWDMFLQINGVTTILAYCFIAISFLNFTFGIFWNLKRDYLIISIAILISIIFIWQFSLLILTNFYPLIFISYPPLLPDMQTFFEYLSNI